MTKKKVQMIFLPLMALGNESQNEYLYGVLEALFLVHNMREWACGFAKHSGQQSITRY